MISFSQATLIVMVSLGGCCLVISSSLFGYGYKREALCFLSGSLLATVIAMMVKYGALVMQSRGIISRSYSTLSGDRGVHSNEDNTDANPSCTHLQNYGSTDSVASTVKAFTPGASSSVETPSIQLQEAPSSDTLNSTLEDICGSFSNSFIRLPDVPAPALVQTTDLNFDDLSSSSKESDPDVKNSSLSSKSLLSLSLSDKTDFNESFERISTPSSST